MLNAYRHVWQAKTLTPVYQDFPTVQDGVLGMVFIEKVVASSQSEEKRTKM